MLSVLTPLFLGTFLKEKQKLPEGIPQILQVSKYYSKYTWFKEILLVRFIIGNGPTTKSSKFEFRWLLLILANESEKLSLSLALKVWSGTDFHKIDQNSRNSGNLYTITSFLR